MTRITVDGVEKEYPAPLTVSRWMALEEVRNPEVVVLIVNDRHVDNPLQSTMPLQNGDRVQILYFLGDS